MSREFLTSCRHLDGSFVPYENRPFCVLGEAEFEFISCKYMKKKNHLLGSCHEMLHLVSACCIHLGPDKIDEDGAFNP